MPGVADLVGVAEVVGVTLVPVVVIVVGDVGGQDHFVLEFGRGWRSCGSVSWFGTRGELAAGRATGAVIR
ncbi:MAG: hypothetical protein HS111_15215 [Kofleriaceae bacterium]|nr:hypothetical protein [Kofleriaceae bacterium]